MSGEIARLFASIGADTSNFKRGMDGVDARMHSTGKSFNAFGALAGAGMMVATTAAVGAAAALGALGTAVTVSTKAAADMEQQLANIAATMGLTADESAKVEGLITDLGLDPTLKVSAMEAAQAVENLGKNGLALSDILDGAARSTVLLANSTGANFGQAADIASDAMAQFGIAASDMGGAVDQITGVTIASKFTIDDYALALAQAGSVAASSGISFDDFNAVIAGTSSSFASGSDAGTSFKTFIQRLIPQTDKAMETMKKLGLVTKDGKNQFFDASGRMKDMAEIVKLLNKAFSGLTEEQRLSAASTLFGTDAMRTAIALAGMTENKFLALKTTIGNTNAETAAARRMDTLSGAMEIFRGVLETVEIAIGNKFLPAAKRITEWATEILSKYREPIITWFGALADSIGALADRLMGAFDANGLNGLLAELGKLGAEGSIALIGWAGDLWEQVQPALVDYTAQLVAWAMAPETWSAIGATMAGAVTALTNWATALWAQVSPQLFKFVDRLYTWITDPQTWLTMATQIEVAWSGFRMWAANIWTQVQPKLVVLGAEMRKWIDANAPSLGTWIDSFLKLTGDIGAGWQLAWPKISGYVVRAADSITNDIDRIIASLNEIGGWFTGGIGKETQDAWKEIFEFFAQITTDAVSSVVNNLANLLEAISVTGQAFQALQAGDWDALGQLNAQLDELASKLLMNMLHPFGVPDVLDERASGGYASGWTVVGEEGAEVVDLPGGSYVHDAAESAQILAGGTASGRIDIYVHGESALPADRQKLRELAVALRKEFNRGGNLVLA